MVRKDRARHHRPWHVHLGTRLEENTQAQLPRVRQGAKNREVEALRSDTPNHSPLNRYSQPAHHKLRQFSDYQKVCRNVIQAYSAVNFLYPLALIVQRHVAQ